MQHISQHVEAHKLLRPNHGIQYEALSDKNRMCFVSVTERVRIHCQK